MGCCINDLRDKEVINVNDGRKFGCVIDVEIDTCSGRLLAIIVPGESKGLFFSRADDIRIPWDKIVRIGDDTILINVQCRLTKEGG
ncbi:MAG: YlmC/YmxH family sporulation protein [Ruminococcaceae bacterium]|nr:YlmC/YmxH family sporulation protein [Oscillospiraceae bacterium]